MTCGIYMIKNKNTTQMYIGQSVDIERRYRQHCNGNDIKSSRIERAMHKHGKENFVLLIICNLENNTELLNEMEKYYIWKYNTYKDRFHYNLTPGGEFSPMKNPDIAKKVAQKTLGKNHPFSGRTHSQETINKMTSIKKGENNPFFNKHHTQESRVKISKSNNTSGYYNVCKVSDKRYKQGFYWMYRWRDDEHKEQKIYSTDLEKLKKRVLEKKLLWYKFN